MISIEFERSPALARVTRAPAAVVRQATLLAAARGAETYVDMIHDWIGAGRAFTPRTGLLEQSIGWHPTADGAVVFANAPHAGFVEHGTKPHLIGPKPGRKALRWYAGSPGAAVFAKEVQHPGTDPTPFFFADFEHRKGSVLQAAREGMAEGLLGGAQ